MEISKELGFHRATVSRILHTLSRFEFLEQNSATKKFSLGLSSVKLGIAVYHHLKSDFVQIAKPYIDELRDKTSETIVLEARAGERIYAAYLAEGLRATRLTLSPGDNLPLNAAAGPKAILAFCPADFRERLINSWQMSRHTPNTTMDKKKLRETISQIRRDGFAFDNEEAFVGIKAIAAPILSHHNEAIGAVVMTMNAHSVELNKNSPLVALVLETAEKISSRLYYNAAKELGEMTP